MIKALILGCGSSSGVPGIGNYWGNCDPDEPKNIRSRTSLALISPTGSIIIDTGADFKYQFNREGLNIPDAIFYTHAHSDHIMGIDEVRWLVEKSSKQQPVSVYGSEPTIKELQKRFNYLFEPLRPDMYLQNLNANIWKQTDYLKMHEVAGFKFQLFPLDHETVTSCGFRFGDFAYTTDVIRIDETVLQELKGVKTWVVDGAAYKDSNNIAHACLDDIYKWNETVQAEQVYFTAMPPSMDYQTVLKEIPTGYAPAYDGLSIDVNEFY